MERAGQPFRDMNPIQEQLQELMLLDIEFKRTFSARYIRIRNLEYRQTGARFSEFTGNRKSK